MKRCWIALPVVVAAVGAQGAGVPGQGTWQTTLQPRDMNGDGAVDAFYDTTLDVTWLRNASMAGRLEWNAARQWADGLTIGGYDDWRLPAVLDTGTPGCNYGVNGSDCGYNVQTRDASGVVYSEFAHLYFVTLGNKSLYDTSAHMQPGYGLTNTGGFEGLQSFDYWTQTELATNAAQAWYFYTVDGAQLVTGKSAAMYTIALRQGDVASIPEPATNALLLAGIAALVATGCRRRRGTDY